MKAKWATTCFVAGALLVPVAGYTADTKETPSKTESAKEVVADSVITTKIKAEFASDKQVSAMKDGRTIYSITPDGRTKFREGLQRQLETEGSVSQTLYGALLFLHLADPAVVVDCLRRRTARLDELIARARRQADLLETVYFRVGEAAAVRALPAVLRSGSVLRREDVERPA